MSVVCIEMQSGDLIADMGGREPEDRPGYRRDPDNRWRLIPEQRTPMQLAAMEPPGFDRLKKMIAASGESILIETLRQHEELIESRCDWSECQKKARRRILERMFNQWQKNQRGR